jgi:glycosyltransferase involved in cell wall biosynthesis
MASLSENLIANALKLILSKGVFDFEFYKNSHDLKTLSDEDLILHYLKSGDQYGYQPNSIFSPNYYRSLNPQGALKKVNTLYHYLIIGSRYGIEPCPGFDTLYISNFYDVDQKDVMQFYVRSLLQGSAANPNQYFDVQYYFEMYPDIKEAKLDAYYHFINWGANEGRFPSKGFSWTKLASELGEFASNAEAFVTLVKLPSKVEESIRKKSSSAKLLEEIKKNHAQSDYQDQNTFPFKQNNKVDVFAFYLAQFHQFDENDEWWGKGFTEWNNVVRGQPRFEGHYQPRIPGDLGFYDLSNKEVIRKQIEIAKNSGVNGFAFYYYNFGSKRLLHKPLDIFLDDPTLDIKFFYIWANETWSRRWDGSEAEILLEQRYEEGLVDEIVSDAIQAFEDPRYHRIDNRPLFVIYRVSVIPKTKEFIEKLRAAFSASNFNPLIYMAQSFNDDNPHLLGLDGAMEFPPHKYTRDVKTTMPKTIYTDAPDLKVYKYDDLIEFAKKPHTENFPLIKACFPSWDNDARRQGNSTVIHGATPEKFRRWLDIIIKDTLSRPDSPKMICVNAWNEWGEGAYLEPDRHFGFSFINALKSIVHKSPSERFGKILLVGHDAFSSGAQRLLLSIAETLKNQFATEVTFLLLRADVGYDGLLKNYQNIARTLIVNDEENNDIKTHINDLASEGYEFAIVNTSVSSLALPYLQDRWKSLQLIHELSGMLDKAGPQQTVGSNLSFATKIVAPTRGVANILKNKYQLNDDKITTFSQGLYRKIKHIDSKKNKAKWLARMNLTKMPKVVVGLGYADHRKGIDLFIDSCELMSKNDSNTVFIWQGAWDGEIRAELDIKIQTLVVAGKLFLEPAGDNVESLLDIADIFFLSSREDPLPTVAFEAWAFGKPVLAFANTGGIADLIEDNKDLGFLVSDVDSKRAAEEIISILSKEFNKSIASKRIDYVTEQCNWYKYVYRLAKNLYDIPEVDVCIIGHNHEKFCDSRIESLIHQTIPPTNITYFDVGSDNKNVEKLKKKILHFSDRVKLEVLPANHGQLYKTWLEVAKSSDAEFIHIAEGDDYVDPIFLEKLILKLIEHPEAGLACSAVQWVDENSKIINESLSDYIPKVLEVDDFEFGFIESAKLLNSGMLVANPILSMSSVVWKRSLLIEALEFSLTHLELLSFAYDWLVYISLINKSGGVIFLKENLTKHRQYEKSMSKGHKSHLVEINKCHKIFDELDLGNQSIFTRRKKYLESL